MTAGRGISISRDPSPWVAGRNSQAGMSKDTFTSTKDPYVMQGCLVLDTHSLMVLNPSGNAHSVQRTVNVRYTLHY